MRSAPSIATEALALSRACRLCESRQLEQLAPPATWIGEDVFAPLRDELGLSRCRQCSYTFTNPRPGPDYLAAFYAGEHYECHQPRLTASSIAQVEIIEQYLGAGTGLRLLDYGCGGGHLLRAAQQRGFRVQGFDIGRQAVETCRALGLPATSDARSLRPGFDAIVLSHVFEHIEDQPAVLADLARLLAPTGRLFIQVPNADSLRARISHPALIERLGLDERYRAFPIHLSYFNAHTLQRILEDNGYAVDDVLTVGFGLEELRATRATPTTSVKEAAAQSAPAQDGVRQWLPSWLKRGIKKAFFGLGLGENLVAVARRRA